VQQNLFAQKFRKIFVRGLKPHSSGEIFGILKIRLWQIFMIVKTWFIPLPLVFGFAGTLAWLSPAGRNPQ
jgi:hypothetical protein